MKWVTTSLMIRNNEINDLWTSISQQDMSSYLQVINDETFYLYSYSYLKRNFTMNSMSSFLIISSIFFGFNELVHLRLFWHFFSKKNHYFSNKKEIIILSREANSNKMHTLIIKKYIYEKIWIIEFFFVVLLEVSYLSSVEICV